jgi:dTDP-glucose 4,6-dehydratase
MKILITGGAGFIGSNFIHYIIKKRPDYKIINLDLLTYAGNLENLKDVEKNPNYKFIQGDICDVELVDKIIKENNIDMIVHFAAESHVDRSIDNPEAFLRTNILGTHTLLEAAKNNGNIRFHHISTDEVFGSLGPQDEPFAEKTAYDPRSPYSASKAASDHLVRAYFHTFDLPITISNCSNNYGPFHYPEKVIPLFITNLLEGKKVPLYGDGMNVRDWLFVEDHCSAIDAIIHNGKIGETYCIGGNCEKTNKEITYKILELMGQDESSIEFVADRLGHDRRYAIDFSKIKKELGWVPKINFEEGLKNTIEWYKNNEDWWKKLKNNLNH